MRSEVLFAVLAGVLAGGCVERPAHDHEGPDVGRINRCIEISKEVRECVEPYIFDSSTLDLGMSAEAGVGLWDSAIESGPKDSGPPDLGFPREHRGCPGPGWGAWCPFEEEQYQDAGVINDDGSYDSGSADPDGGEQ